MRIFFYILREYLKYVVGTVVLTIFLFVLFDFIHKTTKYFADYHPSTENIVRYYWYEMPMQIVQALPIAGLLASVISMILLSRTNEITAMRAAGMGPLQIGAPLAAGGLFLSFLSLFIGEAIVPKSAQKVHYVQEVLIEGEKDEQIADGAKWVRDGKNLINFKDYDPITQTLFRVRFVQTSSGFLPEMAMEADQATFISELHRWKLKNIRLLFFRQTGLIERTESRDTMDLTLPFEPEKLRKDRRKSNEFGIRELHDLIDRGEQTGADIVPFKVDYHSKLAYPFAAFVVSLVGLKFGYKSERSPETAKGVLLAFFIGISYWFVLSASRALGLRGGMPPFLAAWMPNVVVLGFIALDAWIGRKANS